MTQGMVIAQILSVCLQYCYSNACALDLGQTVIITGGAGTNWKVTEYNEDGQAKELPQLITGRYNHGCSSYIDKDGNIVTPDNISHLTGVISCN